MIDSAERKKQIDALRNRMLEELEQWVEENEILGTGETLYFVLEIVKRNSNQTPKVKANKKIPSPQPQLIQLTAADWDKILSIDWSDQHRLIIEKIHLHKNELTTIRYRPHSTREQQMKYGNWNNLDYRFRKYKLPYRLRVFGSTSGFSRPGDGTSYFEDIRFQVWTIPTEKPD